MRLIFAGTPATALPALRALLASAHDVVAVVTRPDAPAGRGRRSTRSEVGQAADAAGLEVLTPDRPSDAAFLTRLTDLAPDCCPVVAYGALVPPAALAVPQHGWVNLHFSLLPAWRGAAPVQHAILAGDEVTGASTFELEAGLDTGPVYGTVTTVIEPDDTTGTLLARLADLGAELLVATIDGIAAGVAVARPQPAEGVSVAPKLTPSDAQIVWSTPALHISRLVRACTPQPGAWTTYDGQRIRLGPVRVDPGSSGDLAAGELRLAGKTDVVVGTGGGVVHLGDVQPAGKARMAADAWARGVRLAPGDRFR